MDTGGSLFQNKTLANVLQNKMQLTCQEWDPSKEKDLRMSHYVQVGKAYYQPVLGSDNSPLITVPKSTKPRGEQENDSRSPCR